mgnify:CR=1 FL=1|jgi:hypothetical protein
MKNIFRKTVQKVRNTTTKVFNTIQENPTLGVAAAGIVLMLGGTIYKVLKTEPDVQLALYNVRCVRDAVQNAYEAFEAGRAAEPEAKSINIAKYGFTNNNAKYLGEIGLCSGVTDKHCGSVNMFFMEPDAYDTFHHIHAVWDENNNA